MTPRLVSNHFPYLPLLFTVQSHVYAVEAFFVTALSDEPLVGRRVTDRFRLILDHGERIVVEP